MQKIDQGTIIFGLKSASYPEFPCYGIVITASCDVENCKVPKFYYLTALEIKDWLCTQNGYFIACKNVLESSNNKLKNESKKNKLSLDVLESFSDDEINKVLIQSIKKEHEREKFYNLFVEHKKINNKNLTIDERKQIIKQNNEKIESCLYEINQGKITQFYFLPSKAYTNSDRVENALIVDLQEIEILSLEHAELLEKNEIDMLKSPIHCKQEDLQNRFWLQSDNDFAFIYEQIKSPWREHFMQRFSFAFTRIGLDNISREDINAIINNL